MHKPQFDCPETLAHAAKHAATEYVGRHRGAPETVDVRTWTFADTVHDHQFMPVTPSIALHGTQGRVQS